MIVRSKGRVRLCLILLCLNLAVIWGNSLLPGSVSGALSQWVKDVLASVFPFISDEPDAGHGLLRKAAHFAEFCSLGLCLSWLVRMLRTNPREHVLAPLLSGVLAACVDETIQHFVPDRGPSIFDVGIDALGVALGVALMAFIIVLKKERTNNF